MRFNWNAVQALANAIRGELLAKHLNQPVQDRTGLTGDYDFTFRLTTEGGMTDHKEVQGGKEVIVHPIEAGGLSPAFLAAIEEQLGLRLDLQTLPQTVLVIDRAEKPSAN